jgi:hypothetical protein
MPSSLRPRLIAARGLPHGVIVCSYETQKALIAAGLGQLDFVIDPPPVTRRPATLTDSQIIYALAAALTATVR